MGTLVSRRSCLGRAGAALAVIVLAGAPAGPARAEGVAEFFTKHTAGAPATVDHSGWDRLLKAYVAASADGVNRVAYARLKKEGHGELKAYLARLQAIDPSKLDRPEQIAFWVNLYNAKTVDVILDKYPVKSIKDISLGGGLKALVTGGPWQAKITRVAGQDLSLDDIEHQILRPIYKDARIHYAVNCASYGCPNLMAQAFTGANLDALLEAGARAYVNHPRGCKFEGGKVKASSIYSWFQVDFGGSDKGVLDHLRKYAAPALKQQLESITGIANYDYDWSLNDAPG
jgi:hypothetical protein